MRRTSTICVLIGTLAALALSANAASAESISVRPVMPTVKLNPPSPKINPGVTHNAVDTFKQKGGTGGDKDGTGGDKDANANGVLIQHIETEHEGFERDNSPTKGTLQINPALVPVSR